MKVYNVLYHSTQQLRSFIEEKNLRSEKRLLVQLFFGQTDIAHIQAVLDAFELYLPNAVVVGASTDGEIMGSEVLTDSTVISFSVFERGTLHPYILPLTQGSLSVGQTLGKIALEREATMMIVLADGLKANGDYVLEGISGIAPNVVIAGGLAGDNGRFAGTVVVCGQTIAQEAVVAVMIVHDTLRILTKYNFNWIPIGPSFTVTKSHENRVFELDHTPILRLYAEYLGDSVAAAMPSVGIEFPLVMYHNGMQYGRACTQAGSDGSLIFSGNVPEGAMVQFGIGNIDMILESAQLMPSIMIPFEPEALFVYSYMARRRFLGHSASIELAPLVDIAPTVGFFTYGEFYSDIRYETKQFLNATMTIVALSETPLSSKGENRTIPENLIRLESSFGKTFKALSHLINKTSIDLQILNDSLRRKIDQEVQKNREKDKMMIAQSKQATMGEMMSMIAHQWRQPLTSIGLLSSTLRMDAEFDELEKDAVIGHTKKIDEQVQYLSKTIDDFRNFFKPNKTAEKFEIHTLFEEIYSMLSFSLKRSGVILEIDAPRDLAIESLKSELMQVLVNMIHNARDTSLEREIKRPVITLQATFDREEVVLVVKDNAGGVSPEIAEKIFEPYFSTKNEKNGTGLGLYMAKTIIEEHLRGELSTFNDDFGAIFVMKLPFQLKGE